MRRLVELELRGTAVTDAGMAQLKGLTRLEGLDLGFTAVVDAGMAQLKGLKNLRTLNLEQTQVGDKSIPVLLGFRRLARFESAGSKLSEAGAAAVDRAMQAPHDNPR